MRKIAVSLTKGGVGKTTTAVNLAAGLAMGESRVLLIDTDTQGQASYMLGLRPKASLADLMTGEAKPEEAIVEARKGLWLLAGGAGLAGVKRQISHVSKGVHTLAKVLAPIEGMYDYVILDTSPGWDLMTINVLFYVTEILAPVSLEVLTIKGLVDFDKRLAVIRRYRAISIEYILPTFLDGRVRKSGEILGQLQAHYGEKICPPIRYNVRLSEAAGYGQTIYEYAPQSPGAEDYKTLTGRIAE
ncbi:MAG: ParA family protein [Deltaproteobacteria bacterium]|nr:ParA family protein [Deltaproteobacteria bacterium]